MTKSYSNWVSGLADSVQDASTVRPETAQHVCKHTNLQIRSLIADLLCPNPRTAGQIEDWLSAFSVRIAGEDEGQRVVRRGWLSEILGEAEYDKYISCGNNYETYRWWKELVSKVERDEIK